MKQDFDIIIIGGGLVGASLAIALSHLSLKIAVLETQEISSEKPLHAENSRPLSLNYGSYKILNTLGIWQKLSSNASPILQVHVSEQGHFGSLKFEAHEYQHPTLGYVVPAAFLQHILQTTTLNLSPNPFILINELINLSTTSSGVEVVCRLKNLEQISLSAQLLIVADGSRSTARQLLNIPVTHTDLQQTAYTATLQTNRPHHGKAFERFTRQGIVALLPLNQSHQYGMVWTTSNQNASPMAQWTPLQWKQELAKAIGNRLGDIQDIQLTGCHPLHMMMAQELVKKHVAVIGNAAHTISPIAAQGFNLSLREVATLSETITQAIAQQKPIGDLDVLLAYDDSIKNYRHATTKITQNIGSIFDIQGFGFSTLRAKGLLALEYLPHLKKKMALQFLGLAGDVPKLARGIPLSLNEF